jgi:hypothetical protein
MGRSGWQGQETTLKRVTALTVIVLLAAAGFAPQTIFSQTSTPSAAGGSPSYVSSTSWALGVVVPNNPHLEGGGELSWEQVDNVTAQVVLPQINQTDGAVLAVISVMRTDGNVLQLAAGIYPVIDRWLTYAQFISNVGATTENYQWIANGSMPEMSPGDIVTLSIFLSSNVWNYIVSDQNSHLSTQGEFPGRGVSLAAGDQEIFALESYSENASVFAHMDNLTLKSLTLDGRIVVQGLYFYNNLEWGNGPVFVVGGFADPPSFISEVHAADGTVVWSYIGEWTGQPLSMIPSLLLTILATIAVIAAAVVIFVRIRRASKLHPF